MIRHHPEGALLLAYAGGATDEAMSLILATHMAYCETCRAEVSRLEAIGGSLLQNLAPVPMSGGALQVALAKLDQMPLEKRASGGAQEASAKAGATIKSGTPAVLSRYIGGDLGAVRWRRVSPKLSYLPLFRRGPVSVRLLRGVPGAETGAHRHQGPEYTLVLKGGFTDVTGSYGPGDLQVMEGEMAHNPIADPGEDCINLAVTMGRLKFQAPLQRVLAPLLGF